MKRLQLTSLGPIRQADIRFGDLTLLVGPQASGKSILLQMLKLLVDKKHIRRTLEQYNFVWGKTKEEVLDRYLGLGMHGIWTSDTEIKLDGKDIAPKFLLPLQSERYKEADEQLFYVPAQRILSLPDGRPKYFTEFDETVPYVLRHFSETLRQLMQDGAKADDVFPQNNRLKKPLRESFNESIFHDGKITMEHIGGQKRLKMNIDGMSIPFLTWSAGQKEFMPLLLSFYWLCPPSRVPTRDAIRYVVIEEPEMGLHPKAIQSVLLQIIDLMGRGYKVVVSTHSPVLLEFAWVMKNLKASGGNYSDIGQLFGIRTTQPAVKEMLKALLDKDIHTYYFQRKQTGVQVIDISTLDAGSDDTAIAEWGGLSSFSSKALDLVAKISANE